jgi:predicted nucleic acid-binding protein
VSVYFFDSSAIVKRYVNETGTAWVKSITTPLAGNRIHLARITGVEVVAAVTKRVREGSITPSAGAAVIAKFRHRFASEYVSADITSVLITAAMQLAEDYVLRGYDAVQLAVASGVNRRSLAIGMPGLTVISADRELNTAATAEGLRTDDPNFHP